MVSDLSNLMIFMNMLRLKKQPHAARAWGCLKPGRISCCKLLGGDRAEDQERNYETEDSS